MPPIRDFGNRLIEEMAEGLGEEYGSDCEERWTDAVTPDDEYALSAAIERAVKEWISERPHLRVTWHEVNAVESHKVEKRP